MSQITIIDGIKPHHGNLYHNTPNQLRRIIGRHSVVYSGGAECGTVRDADGQCWDWWLTDVVLTGGFRKVRVIKAN